MPRIYVTPAELNELPLGIALAAELSQLGAGVLDKMLARASQRADNFCQKRLGAPPSTTVGTGGITAGQTALPVASTLGFDNKDEQAVIVDTGGLQETKIIAPGGVSVSSWASPYPGTLTLDSPCAFSHNAGASVVGVYKEVSEAGRSSSADPYTEALQSQAAQLALAHLPTRHAGLTRVAFVKHYPIIQLLAVEHAYSFDNAYNPIDTSGITVEAPQGWYRFRVGQVILPEGLIRTTYTGGYQVIPDDIKTAVLYFLRDELAAFVNPYNVVSQTMGKRSQTFRSGNSISVNVAEAEALLERYKRMV